ncbi:MAG TPA: hypothetical protein VGC89_11260 [Pyrinomonadaceae bacterium]|jgi:hypothetical protein
MNECKGKWDSSITWTRRHKKDIPVAQQKKERDGLIKIDAHSSSNVTGQHEKVKTRALRHGKCSPLGGSMFSISFQREDDETGVTETFIYTGSGSGDNISGTVTVDTDLSEPGDSGTWESTRRGGDDDGDEDKDKHHRAGTSPYAEQRPGGSQAAD